MSSGACVSTDENSQSKGNGALAFYITYPLGPQIYLNSIHLLSKTFCKVLSLQNMYFIYKE